MLEENFISYHFALSTFIIFGISIDLDYANFTRPNGGDERLEL